MANKVCAILIAISNIFNVWATKTDLPITGREIEWDRESKREQAEHPPTDAIIYKQIKFICFVLATGKRPTEANQTNPEMIQSKKALTLSHRFRFFFLYGACTFFLHNLLLILTYFLSAITTLMNKPTHIFNSSLVRTNKNRQWI